MKDYSASPEQSPLEQSPSPEQPSINEISLNPFVVGSKHGRDIEEEEDNIEEEYNADKTIIGGGNVSWVVDDLNIRQKLTEYQKKKPPKTKPEYYDVIFFNAIDKNGFLETLGKDTVALMLEDIRDEEEETQDNMEQDVKSLLDRIIMRDISKTKSKLQQYKDRNNSFEKAFAINFVDHM
jgi:hypothetical protein